MTTEQVPSPPAGFDTRVETEALIEAGVPEESAVAVLYTGLRAADARFAMLVEEMKRDREERARENAALRKELKRDRKARKEENAALRKELLHEIRHTSTTLQMRGTVALVTVGLGIITVLQFFMGLE